MMMIITMGYRYQVFDIPRCTKLPEARHQHCKKVQSISKIFSIPRDIVTALCNYIWT